MQSNERLRGFIVRQGCTQEAFAEQMGLARETVTRLLSGSQPITGSFIGKFYMTFGSEALAEVFPYDSPEQIAEAA